MSELDKQVDEFNEKYPVGTEVRYWKGARRGPAMISKTRTRAEVLAGHTPVVWIEDSPACVSLSHIEPV